MLFACVSEKEAPVGQIAEGSIADSFIKKSKVNIVLLGIIAKGRKKSIITIDSLPSCTIGVIVTKAGGTSKLIEESSSEAGSYSIKNMVAVILPSWYSAIGTGTISLGCAFIPSTYSLGSAKANDGIKSNNTIKIFIFTPSLLLA